MKLLALDTCTERISLALQVDQVRHVISEPGGARASARLIPAIQELLAQADLPLTALDAIVVGVGPGSFTGLRSAVAVAQGLAMGADLPLLPFDSLLALAEDVRQRALAGKAHVRVQALLDARMGQIYAARYVFDSGSWSNDGACSLIQPEALECVPGELCAGNARAAYGARLPLGDAPWVDALPESSAMLDLAPTMIRAGLAQAPELVLPHYVRDKVALTSAERARGLRL